MTGVVDRIIQALHFYLGLFPDRVRDPFVVLARAENYLIREYSTPAMLERGYYLPEQVEAFNILEQLQKQIPAYSRGWVAPRGEQ